MPPVESKFFVSDAAKVTSPAAVVSRRGVMSLKDVPSST